MAGQYLGANSWQTTNAAGNQTTVYCTITLYSNNWSYDGYTVSHRVWIGGQNYDGDGPRTLYSPNTWSATYSRTFNHDANGYRGAVGCSAELWGSGPYMPGYLSADGGTQGAVDFDRRPATPGAPSVTVNSDKTISLSWSAVSSPASTATYYIQYASATGGGGYGSWSSEVSTTSTSYVYSGLARGVTYKFRLRAANSDGTTGYGAESGANFLPAGGKIYESGAWRLTAFGKKFNGTSWVDLTTAKKFDGSTWVDLS